MIGCVAKAVGTASSFTISIRTPAGAKLRLLIDVFADLETWQRPHHRPRQRHQIF